MADVVRPAVGRVQGGAAIDEADEFLFERSELDPPFANFGDLVGQKRCDVAARRGAIVAEFDHTADLGEGEPGRFRGPDEAQLVESSIIVGAVAVG